MYNAQWKIAINSVMIINYCYTKNGLTFSVPQSSEVGISEVAEFFKNSFQK